MERAKKGSNVSVKCEVLKCEEKLGKGVLSSLKGVHCHHEMYSIKNVIEKVFIRFQCLIPYPFWLK